MQIQTTADAAQQFAMDGITQNRQQYLLSLMEGASRCYQSSQDGDIEGSQDFAKQFLTSIEDALNFFKNLPENEEKGQCAFEFLRDLQWLITSSDPQSQVLLDSVTLDLPMVIVNYMDIWEECRDVCSNIITQMCQSCSPPEMVSVICEALSSICERKEKLSSCLSFLHGFSIVIHRIQRRPVENVKVAVPMILKVGKLAASIESDEDNRDDTIGIFDKLIAIAASLQEVCKKQVVEQRKQQLQSILAVYTLQLLALISRTRSVRDSMDTSNAPTSILQLSEILSNCEHLYLGLITGTDVEAVYHLLDNDENDKIVESISLVSIGAILAVLWGCVFTEVAKVTHDNVHSLIKKLQNCQSERVRALSNMKYLLSSPDYPWQIKIYCIEFLLSIIEDNSASSKEIDEKIDWPSIGPSFFSLLQGVQQIMVYAPDPEQRKKAFLALKKILGELPPHLKFDILKALVINSNNPSMVAILLGIVRDEISNAIHIRNAQKDEESPFLTVDVLELVQLFLKPQKGGPPDLPGQCDAVLAALNLYRFILMIELHGKTNYTGVLSKSCLKKAHSEWLLPLRVFISGIRSENANDSSEFATSTSCALNPIELALYHCIELVEERLRHCA